MQARLNQNQQHLLQKVRTTSNQRTEKFIQAANLNPQQREDLERARSKLESARLVINCNLKEEVFAELPLVENLLRSRRLYNLFEIDYASADINPAKLRARLMSEFKLYGATPDIQVVLSRMSNTEHPHYATLDYIGDPIAFSSPGYFGWYRFQLKDDVKRRCTFTPADSFVLKRNQVFLWNEIVGVLASRTGEEQRFWFEYVNEGIEPFNSDGSASYIEAQILGGVFMHDDVDLLFYPETDRFNTAFFKKLQRLSRSCHFKLIAY